MSDDGADLGISAEAGMKAALGADEEPVTRTPEEFRAHIEANQDGGYEGCANRAAMVLVRLFEEGAPHMRTWPAEAPYHYEIDGERVTDLSRIVGLTPQQVDVVKDGPSLFDAVKEARSDLYDDVWSQMSGFQWGWAVNAAKYIVGEPPVPNPAIITIGSA